MTEKGWKGTGRQNEDACRTKDSGKKQHWKACVRCAVGTVTGYMDLRTGDEIKPIFDMDFGCDQRAYTGCRDPALCMDFISFSRQILKCCASMVLVRCLCKLEFTECFVHQNSLQQSSSRWKNCSAW